MGFYNHTYKKIDFERVTKLINASKLNTVESFGSVVGLMKSHEEIETPEQLKASIDYHCHNKCSCGLKFKKTSAQFLDEMKQYAEKNASDIVEDVVKYANDLIGIYTIIGVGAERALIEHLKQLKPTWTYVQTSAKQDVELAIDIIASKDGTVFGAQLKSKNGVFQAGEEGRMKKFAKLFNAKYKVIRYEYKKGQYTFLNLFDNDFNI